MTAGVKKKTEIEELVALARASLGARYDPDQKYTVEEREIRLLVQAGGEIVRAARQMGPFPYLTEVLYQDIRFVNASRHSPLEEIVYQ